MAERKPFVNIGGMLQELPAEDSLPGVGGSASRTELMVSDTDSPPVILTNEDATDFLYSD